MKSDIPEAYLIQSCIANFIFIFDESAFESQASASSDNNTPPPISNLTVDTT